VAVASPAVYVYPALMHWAGCAEKPVSVAVAELSHSSQVFGEPVGST
jgi:hypothetical protein